MNYEVTAVNYDELDKAKQVTVWMNGEDFTTWKGVDVHIDSLGNLRVWTMMHHHNAGTNAVITIAEYARGRWVYYSYDQRFGLPIENYKS